MSLLNKKTVDDINVKGQKVLVRCDFNVPLKNGVITHSVTQGELTAELLSETFDTDIKILSAEGRSFIVGDVFYEN